MEGENCLLVGESWNLKGRLLELANAINGSDGLILVYELCDEEARILRRDELTREFIPQPEPSSGPAPKRLPGISLSDANHRINGRTG
jgi:hypothetical protein